ncbi:MAG: GNAT family N-acetyltransferase [Bacteroidota bacterium]|nr:GNAT family N-acetyltransferase [Bacteroidota bacterium]
MESDERKTVTLSENITIRTATPADIKILMHHRRRMFFEMGYTDEAVLAGMEATSEPFFLKGLANGSFHAWLAENSSQQVVAGGGVIVFDYPPSARDSSPKRPIIVNVYTEPEYRRRGIARKLMEMMIEWCRAQNFGSIMLHASDEGRRLYESLGFQQTNEMRLMLR